MKQLTIPYIEGDGIGQEITKATLALVEQSVNQYYPGKYELKFVELLAGQKAFDQAGEYLPGETVDKLKEYKLGIKGPLMTPVGKGFRSLNVALRQELDLYTCYRPVKYYQGVPSPVKRPQLVDVHIFRENTEDIYAGIEFEMGSPENNRLLEFLIRKMDVKNIRFPETTALGLKPISEEGSKRLIRAAIQFALDNGLPSVTLVHKGNIMKYTEGAFRKWGYELAREEFADKVVIETELNGKSPGKKIVIKDCIADAFLQNLLLKSGEYSVIATTNLNGDYISDMAAAMVGGIGMAPGANINFQKGIALFEATHGTAPDIAGKGKANPGSLILSAALMLDYLNLNKSALAIRRALEQVIINKEVTSDLFSALESGRLLNTSAFAQAISENL